MSRAAFTPEDLDPEMFDPLVVARTILRDPQRYVAGTIDGLRLDDLQRQAVLAELQTMAQLAEDALLPGDPDREAILAAYAAATETAPAIPAGR